MLLQDERFGAAEVIEIPPLPAAQLGQTVIEQLPGLLHVVALPFLLHHGNAVVVVRLRQRQGGFLFPTGLFGPVPPPGAIPHRKTWRRIRRFMIA